MTKSTQNPAGIINTKQLSRCPNCNCITYTLMDVDGNRICGKCQKSKIAIKPEWLEKHVCRFNDGGQSCDCFVAGYKTGEKEGIEQCLKILEEEELRLPPRLTQSQIFLNITCALRALLPLDTNN